MDDVEFYFGMFISFMMGVLAVGIVVDFVWDMDGQIRELGQSICDQEYDMDYESYNNGVLKCKNKEEVVEYDGIEILIGDGR